MTVFFGFSPLYRDKLCLFYIKAPGQEEDHQVLIAARAFLERVKDHCFIRERESVRDRSRRSWGVSDFSSLSSGNRENRACGCECDFLENFPDQNTSLFRLKSSVISLEIKQKLLTHDVVFTG